MYRDRDNLQKHTEYKNAHHGCPFCEPQLGSRSIIKQYNSFIVTKNNFPYSHWDGNFVAKHYLLTPREHIDSLDLLNENDKREYVEIISYYEAQGYNVYSRGKGSKQKSESHHQHTHLIKSKPQTVNFLLYIKKPLIIFKY